jgi:D-beta-D-heptose 7-phosphate kinase/D-beta-D-heptose 1-phosphate adenosyltransferase
MENILKFLDHDLHGPKIKIAVLGDAMVDEYYDVSVKKLSQECPLPVMKISDDAPHSFPGGAANVAYQFSNFNVHSSLFSFTDKEAQIVFEKSILDAKNCLQLETPIPRKKRYFSEHYPVARLDVEGKNYRLNNDELERRSYELYNLISCGSRNEHYNCIIFTDYDKGIFNNLQKWIFELAPITIVDPKDGDFRRWKGCTVFKPNKDEALKLTKKNNIIDAGNMLADELDCAVVITQAGDGVTVFQSGEIHQIKPKSKVQVPESVIGAGDAFVSFLAMALSRKFSLLKAVEIAFQAGTVYVQNKHNKPLNHFDIHHFIDPVGVKLIDDPKKFFANRNYKLVMTNGCFDIFHFGHLESLKAARSHGDKLLVAINTDESVSRLKPGRPIMPLQQRLAILQSCEYVDFVVSFDEETPEKLIREVMPDVVAKGGDYKLEEIIGYGIVPEVIRLPMVDGLSSTKIIKKIKS